MSINFGGTVPNQAADASVLITVPFGVSLVNPVVTVSVIDAGNNALEAKLTAAPSATGFTALIGGGPPLSTATLSWQVTAQSFTPVIPPSGSPGGTPQGRSGAQAIMDVRDNCDEYTLPSNATILRFLNRGIEEVERRLNGIFVWTAYPTVAMQTFVSLNDDLQYIESLSWSSGAVNTSGVITNSSPLSPGSLVYPVRLMEQGSFMDFAAGFPAVGFGPPNKALIYTDQGTAPGTTLPNPAAPILIPVAGTSAGVPVSVVFTYASPNGETTPSPAMSLTPGNQQQIQAMSPQGYSNADGYNVYASVAAGPYYLQNVTGLVALGTPFTLPGTTIVTGNQPPGTNSATGSGTGGAMFLQLYPAAMIGQLNVYGRMRPQLWADATTASWTNLDTSMQEAVVVWATYRVLRNRSRYDDAKDYLMEFQGADGESGMIGSLKESALRRTRPQSGIVRDVSGPGLTGAPFWA